MMFQYVRNFGGIGLLFMALVLVQGCVSTPPASLIKLARISPMEADPAQIRFGVITPGYLQVATGDMLVSLNYVSDDGSWKVAQQFLPIVGPQIQSKAMTSSLRKGEHAWSARLAPEDADRFARMQLKIRQDRDANGGGQGSLGIQITACANQPLPKGSIPVSTFIKTVATSDFFPLQQRIDLRKSLRKAAGGQAVPLERIRRCSVV